MSDVTATRHHGAQPFGGTKAGTDVAHLLRRAGFGGTPSEVAAAIRVGRASTINRLVDYAQTPDAFVPPSDTAISLIPTNKVDELTVWWIKRMLTTSRPLQEKMVLFWHGHFATAIQKVRNPGFMYRQNQLFRDNALGRFDDLLSAVYKDPAMLVWLDGRRNTKVAPNENWGREVMELFTIGHGEYTEDDVHANSRAFTGWTVDQLGNVAFIPPRHDDGIKTLLGQTGNWNGEDAVRILCAHPATGPFLAGKLWRFFASDRPPAAALNAMAKAYTQHNHSVAEMVRTLFCRPEFYSHTTRTAHIKSPTEFVVSSMRQIGLANPDLSGVPLALTMLGQQLFNPPNVGGWPGGTNWINPSTMLGRFNFASQLTGDTGRTGAIDSMSILQASKASSMHQLASFITGMLGVQPGTETTRAVLGYAGKGTVSRPDTDAKIRGLIHLTLASPEYQVA